MSSFNPEEFLKQKTLNVRNRSVDLGMGGEGGGRGRKDHKRFYAQ